ncbi:hypothetical protein SDC9_123819 [bioreactor metagenome]|uniref:Uncharacterized protein n=1 Tax=bioreactor metagenome TaxID=1076179 RepID=A0A645CIP7_9ZZZZ
MVPVGVGEEYRVDIGKIGSLRRRFGVACKKRIDEPLKSRALDAECAVSKITKFRHYLYLHALNLFLTALI